MASGPALRCRRPAGSMKRRPRLIPLGPRRPADTEGRSQAACARPGPSSSAPRSPSAPVPCGWSGTPHHGLLGTLPHRHPPRGRRRRLAPDAGPHAPSELSSGPRDRPLRSPRARTKIPPLRRAPRPLKAAARAFRGSRAGKGDGRPRPFAVSSNLRRGVAQPGRALGSGPRGRRFESSRPDHKLKGGGWGDPDGLAPPRPARMRRPGACHGGPITFGMT